MIYRSFQISLDIKMRNFQLHIWTWKLQISVLKFQTSNLKNGVGGMSRRRWNPPRGCTSPKRRGCVAQGRSNDCTIAGTLHWGGFQPSLRFPLPPGGSCRPPSLLGPQITPNRQKQNVLGTQKIIKKLTFQFSSSLRSFCDFCCIFDELWAILGSILGPLHFSMFFLDTCFA